MYIYIYIIAWILVCDHRFHATHISRRQPQICRTAHISSYALIKNHFYDHKQ